MESWDRCAVETRFRLGRFQQSSRPRWSTSQDAGARKRPPRPVETGDVWHWSLTPNEIKDSNDLLLSVAVATQKIQSKGINQPFHDLMIYKSNFSILLETSWSLSVRFCSQASTGEHLMAPAIPWISVFRILTADGDWWFHWTNGVLKQLFFFLKDGMGTLQLVFAHEIYVQVRLSEVKHGKMVGLFA